METELRPDQIAAIKRSVLVGQKLQLTHPEILDMYRNGETLEEIANDLDIVSTHNVSKRIAITSVSHALRGYDGFFEGESYSGLADKSELDRLAYERQIGTLRDNQKKSDETRKRKCVGIYGLTKDQLSSQGRKGGKKGGRTVADRKIGIHALTYEQRQQIGYNIAISQGKLPWIKREENPNYTKFGELEFGYGLTQLLKYQYQTGRNKGRPHWKLIAERINEIYHDNECIRTPEAVRTTINKVIREGKI